MEAAEDRSIQRLRGAGMALRFTVSLMTVMSNDDDAAQARRKTMEVTDATAQLHPYRYHVDEGRLARVLQPH